MPITIEQVEDYYRQKQSYLDILQQNPGEFRQLKPLEPKTDAEREAIAEEQRQQQQGEKAEKQIVIMPHLPQEEEPEHGSKSQCF